MIYAMRSEGALRRHASLESRDEAIDALVLARLLLNHGGSEPPPVPAAAGNPAAAAAIPATAPFRRLRVVLEDLAETPVLLRLQLVHLEVVESHFQRSRVPGVVVGGRGGVVGDEMGERYRKSRGGMLLSNEVFILDKLSRIFCERQRGMKLESHFQRASWDVSTLPDFVPKSGLVSHSRLPPERSSERSSRANVRCRRPARVGVLLEEIMEAQDLIGTTFDTPVTETGVFLAPKLRGQGLSRRRSRDYPAHQAEISSLW